MNKSILLLVFTSFIWSLKAQEVIRCANEKYAIEGVLSNSSSKLLVMQQTSGIKPEIGGRGELLKYFQSKMFGGNVSGTMVIAEVEITDITGSQVMLKVLEEKSKILVNGKKKNHFIKGNKVKLKIYDYQKVQEKKEYWGSGKLRAKGLTACGQKIGKWTYFDEQGLLSKIYEQDDEGRITGEYKEFYPNGKLALKGEYKRNERVGKWNVFNQDGSDGGYINYRFGEKYGKYELKYPNGQVKESGEYSLSGKLTGVQKGFYQNGKPRFLKDSDKHLYKEWFQNGQLKVDYKLNYKGEKDGLCKEYYDNGQLKSEIEYDDEEFEGIYKTYYDDGKPQQIGQYYWSDHQKDGEWLTYYGQGGVMKRKNYKRGQLHGKVELYFKNGKVKASTHYSDGQPDGEFVIFWGNGSLKEKGAFVKGKENGTFIKTFKDGTTGKLTTYELGKKEGPFEEYYAPGKIKVKGNYHGEMYIGSYEKYYENGKLESKGTYSEDGKRIGLWIFNNDEGKILKKGKYENGIKTGKWIEIDEKGKKKKVKY